jgi:NhaP-type Na+/H+ or K+/H+ antiporter
MITVDFQIILAIGIMILAYVTVIHRLLISRQMSDKLYKNFGLGILVTAVYVSCTSGMFMGFDCIAKLGLLQDGKMTLEQANEMYGKLIKSLNEMTTGLIVGIVFYMLTLLLVKSILRDIEKDFDKPKYRWGKLDKEMTNN